MTTVDTITRRAKSFVQERAHRLRLTAPYVMADYFDGNPAVGRTSKLKK